MLRDPCARELRFKALFETAGGERVWRTINASQFCTNALSSHRETRVSNWLQYTGVNDLCGTPIYEGDVVEYVQHLSNPA